MAWREGSETDPTIVKYGDAREIRLPAGKKGFTAPVAGQRTNLIGKPDLDCSVKGKKHRCPLPQLSGWA